MASEKAIEVAAMAIDPSAFNTEKWVGNKPVARLLERWKETARKQARAALDAAAAVDGDAQREALAQFMIRHSFATGHGDTHAGLLAELEAHMQELRDTRWNAVLCEVSAERRRQIEQEGWKPEHDDEHIRGEIASAAASYAVCGLKGGEALAIGIWPWSRSWWKPKDRRRDLVRAGALIVAEIERLDRASIRSLKRLK